MGGSEDTLKMRVASLKLEADKELAAAETREQELKRAIDSATVH